MLSAYQALTLSHMDSSPEIAAWLSQFKSEEDRLTAKHMLMRLRFVSSDRFSVWLKQTQAEFSVKLNNHLPTGNAKFNAAQAFEWLATQESAKLHIQALHDKLKEKNIWLWKLGAIEPYLGLDTNSKSEGTWMTVKQNIEMLGISSVVKNEERKEMLEWLCE